MTPSEGFPGGSAAEELACNAEYLGSIPGSGISPGEGNSYPLQYSGLENSMDCIVHGVTKNPWGHKESDTTERLSLQRAQWGLWTKLCLCLHCGCQGRDSGQKPREPSIGTEIPPQPSGGWEGRFTAFISSSPHRPPCVGAELLSLEEAFQLGKLPEVYTSYSFLEEAEVQKTWVLSLALPLTSCVNQGQLPSALALGLGFHIWGKIFSYHHIPMPGALPGA